MNTHNNNKGDTMINQKKAIRILKEHGIDWKYKYYNKPNGYVDLTRSPGLLVKETWINTINKQNGEAWIECPSTSNKLLTWLGY